MTPLDLALRHVELDDRARLLAAERTRIEERLGADPEAERLATELAELGLRRSEQSERLAAREAVVAAHRDRLRAKQRELMSGHTSSGSELMKMSAEVDHLRAALGLEEEEELVLMEEEESLAAEAARLEAGLAAARARAEAAAPGLQVRLAAAGEELAAAQAERDATWEQMPEDLRREYARIGQRTPRPVAAVVDGQCQACHVQLTTNSLQQLRRGGLVECDHCRRILVLR